ncbi:MAG: hypothetical protein E7437_07355 [Ruminococcaceae bacterium]|nr:hypothetical protein [Oscillospiraceae bacterium]
MDTNTILSKYDHLPEPQNQYEKARLDSAKTACKLLNKVSLLSLRIQANLCYSVISLCRRAGLTSEERDSIFGQGTLEQHLFERILDGDEHAMTLAILEAIEKGEFKSAAQLARDVKHWDDMLEGELDSFQLNHSPDAAMLCLMGNRLGDIPFWRFDLKDMMAVAKLQHPHIEMFFELL